MSEASTPATPEEYQRELDFELVTRKRKGKRKKIMLKHSTDPQISSTQYDEDVQIDNRNDDVTNVIHGEPVHFVEGKEFRAVASTFSRVTLDGQMIRPPEVINPEGVTPFEKEPMPQEEEVKPIYAREEAGMICPAGHEPITKINTRALPRSAATYELEKFEKNYLLIFNQKHVDGYKPRLGTEQDVAALTKTFKNFGFKVEVEEDLMKDQIMAKLKEFSSQDFTNYGCVAIAVLTHGSKDGRIRAKNMPYSELEIVNHLHVHDKPTLITKPRIVIIQACRGSKEIRGVPVSSPYSARIQKDLDEEVEPYTLPVESDMLILHSSYIGKPSHRDEGQGSWFVQSLCSKINQLSTTHDFESILTEVKREVAIDREHVEHNKRTSEDDINKQMPVSTSTLIRKLYFKKFGDEPSTLQASHNEEHMNTHSVLDTSIPNTPLLAQFSPCSCFLEHFTYLRNCLSYFVADNPGDCDAKALLNVASAFEDEVSFNNVKERMTEAISNLLRTRGRDYPYYKYLYFYKK